MSLGIYFGYNTINIVQTRRKSLITSTVIPAVAFTPAELEEKVPWEVKVLTLLKEAFEKEKIKPGEATIALSGRDLIIRSFDLPALPKDELYNAVNFEVKKYIPFKAEDLVSDFQVKLDKLNRRNHVLYAGIKKDVLDKYLNLFKELGIKVQVLEYSAFGLLRILSLSGHSIKGIVGIVNVTLQEHEESNFFVLDDGFPLFSRDIILTAPAAQEPSPAAELESGMLLEKLKTELRVSLDFYERKLPDKTIKNIFLICDQAHSAELGLSIKEMGLGSEFIDLSRYTGKKFAFSLGLVKGYGCALSEVIKTGLRLNLLQPRPIPKLALPIEKKLPELGKILSLVTTLKIKRAVIALTIILCLAPLSYGLRQKFLLHKDIRGIVSLRPKTSSIDGSASLEVIKSLDAEFKNKVATLDNLVKAQLYITEPLDVLARITPDGLWFVDFSLDKDRHDALLLSGLAYLGDSSKEIALVNSFSSALKENEVFRKYFKEIEIVSVESRLLRETTTTAFRIICKK